MWLSSSALWEGSWLDAALLEIEELVQEEECQEEHLQRQVLVQEACGRTLSELFVLVDPMCAYPIKQIKSFWNRFITSRMLLIVNCGAVVRCAVKASRKNQIQRTQNDSTHGHQSLHVILIMRLLLMRR